MLRDLANAITGCQKTVETGDDAMLLGLYSKRLALEISGAELGDESKGYVFKIMRGCDKQGFPERRGILTQGHVQLLMHQESRTRMRKLFEFDGAQCDENECDGEDPPNRGNGGNGGSTSG